MNERSLRGRDHIVIGAFTAVLGLGALAAVGAPIDQVAITTGAVAAGAGALLPDLDHPRSKASSGLPIQLLAEGLGAVVFIGAIVYFLNTMGLNLASSPAWSIFEGYFRFAALAIVGALVLFGASAAIRSFSSHRGITHSLFFAAVTTALSVVGCLLGGIPAWYGLLVGWGCLSHVVADGFTPTGTPYLWWPWSGQTGFPQLESPSRDVPRTHALRVRSTSAVSQVVRSPNDLGPLPVAAPDPGVLKTAPLCPRCGIPMALRVAKRGEHPGSRFYGCKNFPRCRRTRKFS